MSISTEQYERILHFLDGSMTLEEMEVFEKELAANLPLRQQLDFEQSVRDGFAFKKNTETKVPGNIIEGKINGETKYVPVKSMSRKRWLTLSVAASVTVAIAALAFFYTQKNKNTTIARGNADDTTGVKKKDTTQVVITKPVDSSQTLALLYKQYFTKDAIPESYPIVLAEAFINYDNGNYASIQKLNLAAIPAMRGTQDKQAILELGHYYKGIAFLKTNNNGEAINNLHWMDKNCTDNDLKVKAQWYLALAYLKTSNITEAINLLKKITTNKINILYSNKANHLLKTLQQ